MAVLVASPVNGFIFGQASKKLGFGLSEGELGLATRRSTYVPLLGDLAPDGFFYGGHYVVMFDPGSLWYETSLTVAAQSLRQGMKTQYHVFQHFPSEAIEALSKLGIDTKKAEQDGILEVWDSYTETTEYEAAEKKRTEFLAGEPAREKPLDLKKAVQNWNRRVKQGFSEAEKNWLHLDDNVAIFLQYNDEKTAVDAWRTAVVPMLRARGLATFHAFVRGAGSAEFYTKFEALCDGVIDLKAQEENGKIENYIRIRILRGKTFDSRWHPIQLSDTGEVNFVSVSPGQTRRLAAIMYTDMIGYTSLGQRDESLSLALVQEQRGVIRPILARYNGREVKTMGDAFLIEFPNALDAVKCAYEIQKATKEHNASLPAEQRIHLRAGVHVGDVVESLGDILGDSVNVASRIEPLAEDGGVCLSRQVYDHVHNKFELPLENLGLKQLKNVSTAMEVFRMVMPWDQTRLE